MSVRRGSVGLGLLFVALSIGTTGCQQRITARLELLKIEPESRRLPLNSRLGLRLEALALELEQLAADCSSTQNAMQKVNELLSNEDRQTLSEELAEFRRFLGEARGQAESLVTNCDAFFTDKHDAAHVREGEEFIIRAQRFLRDDGTRLRDMGVEAAGAQAVGAQLRKLSETPATAELVSTALGGRFRLTRPAEPILQPDRVTPDLILVNPSDPDFAIIVSAPATEIVLEVLVSGLGDGSAMIAVSPSGQMRVFQIGDVYRQAALYLETLSARATESVATYLFSNAESEDIDE